MAGMVGDVGVKLGMDEQDLIRGEQRVLQALNELKGATEQVGRTIDKAIGDAATRMEQAARATIEYAEAQKRAEAEARKASEEAKRGAAEAKKTADEKKRLEADVAAHLKKLRDKALQEAKEAEREVEKLAKQEAEARKQAAEQAAAAERKATQDRKQALADMKAGLMQIGVAATAAAAALMAMAKTSLDAFKSQQSAFMGLEAVSTRTIGSFTEAKKAAQSLASDGLMSVVETSKAVQAGLASGFNLEQTVNMIKAFKDSAAFNRQSGLEFGESVSRAMEGVRMGNSVLSDSAGITKNLSQILKEAGKSEQDLARVSSDASVRRALYNGLLREGSIFQGNAAKSAETLAGAEARNATEAFNASAAFGEALAPAIQAVLRAVTPMLSATTDLIKAHPELARTLFLVVGGTLALAGAFSLAAVAAMSFQTALGPIGWAVLAIGALTGATVGLTIAQQANRAEGARIASSTTDLLRQYEALRKIVDSNTSSTDQKTKAQQRLKDVMDKLLALQPQMKTWFDSEGRILDSMKGKYDDLTTATLRAAKAQLALTELESTKELGEIDKRLAAKEQMNPEWVKRRVSPGDFLGVLTGGKSRADIEAANVQAFELERLRDEARRAQVIEEREKLRAKIKGLENPMSPEEALGPPLPDGFGNGAPPKGSKEMSAALKAALEDLQDLQALEKSPDNLNRILTKVRQVLAQHGAELKELDKDRDLIRQRDITLPEQIAQAQYTEALKLLDADKALKNLSPEKFAAGLRDIRDRFAAYLEQHPDQALQLQLKIKGSSDEEIRAPLERWQQAMQQAQQAGQFDGAGGMDRQLLLLRNGLALAAGAGDQNTVSQLTGQIKQLEQALQAAAFEERFKAIADAREQAFTGAAGALAEIQKQLASEEALGDQTDPNRLRGLKQQLLDTVKPFLEAQRAALAQLMTDVTLTTEQRAQVERQFNQVQGELYQQDVDAHRLALEARVAAEKAAEQRIADARKQAADTLKDLRSALQDAQRQDLDHLKAKQEAEELRQGKRIKGLQDELAALERQWAREDQRKRMADLQTELANVKADTRFEYVDPVTGEKTYTYDRARAAELEKQIADEKLQTQRDHQRDSLQDQIANEQQRLEAMRTANQRAYDERQTAWQNLLALDDEQLAELVAQTDAAMGDGEDGWNGVLTKWLNEAVSTAQTKAASITRALQSAINKAREAQDALSSVSGGGTGGASPVSEYRRGNVRAFAHGGMADPSNPYLGLVGERVREYMVPEDYLGELAGRIARLLSMPMLFPGFAAPTMPASFGAAATGGGPTINLGGIQIVVHGAADPQATAAAVQPAVARGVQQGLTTAGFNEQIRHAIRVISS